MNAADQFEAFKRLADEQGLGAEEIAARFGVSAHVVRQRMRLGALSPLLMGKYRDGEVTLEQLMAFAISEDHGRQEHVYRAIQEGWNKQPAQIRRLMMETHVEPDDPRALFAGEAYAEAGGAVLRDLFSEADGGYLADVELLDRLVVERLNAIAAEVQAEGWKWVEARLEFPYDHGMRRVYPQQVELCAENAASGTCSRRRAHRRRPARSSASTRRSSASSSTARCSPRSPRRWGRPRVWVHEYNHTREHQSLGHRPPIERFATARPLRLDEPELPVATSRPTPRLIRRVLVDGTVSLLNFKYHVGRYLAGQSVEVVSHHGLVEVVHEGVVIATHARRHLPEQDDRLLRQALTATPTRPATDRCTSGSSPPIRSRCGCGTPSIP